MKNEKWNQTWERKSSKLRQGEASTRYGGNSANLLGGELILFFASVSVIER